ncbi:MULTISPECIES: AI-2E family transporter [Paenibacillus]|uniref:AI-2E family transporter n=1 Tax=Paenibacillus borealis TaxID=160799 RepID=A0ABX3H568_PAEBO|nr:AI-2E family transporter [Paenibacillus borealis]OMD45566.1 AI-2E family transporter [Paenibacillus borealis]
MKNVNKFLTIGKAILLVLAIIYVGSLVDFIFKPFKALTGVILIPMLLAVFFYYILRPLIPLLEKWKLKRTPAILLIYLFLFIIVMAFFGGVWPPLKSQLINLVQNAPHLFNLLNDKIVELEKTGVFSKIFPEDFSLLSQLNEYLNKGFTLLTSYVTGLFSAVSNLAIILFTFPILLFYMLKEGDKFGKIIVRAVPKRSREKISTITKEIDAALSSYIVSRVVVNLALGVLMYFGFLLIGLPYALVLTLIAVIMNFIPYFGAIISSVPIVIVGLVESPAVGLWALVIILLAQQVQDNIISPLVFGKSLDIHPITTTVLVLGVGNFFGFIGMLIIIPVYMVIKIISKHTYHLFFKEKWEGL